MLIIFYGTSDSTSIKHPLRRTRVRSVILCSFFYRRDAEKRFVPLGPRASVVQRNMWLLRSLLSFSLSVSINTALLRS